MQTFLIVIHVIVSIVLIVIVLLQHGKGADIGATFGGGGGNTLFGTEGPMPLMNKVTTTLAAVFMVTSITLAYISAHQSGSVMKAVAVKAKKTQPQPAAAPGKNAAPLPMADAVPEKAPATFPGAKTDEAGGKAAAPAAKKPEQKKK
jgi:preprotein translocase subunit SecG